MCFFLDASSNWLFRIERWRYDTDIWQWKDFLSFPVSEQNLMSENRKKMSVVWKGSATVLKRRMTLSYMHTPAWEFFFMFQVQGILRDRREAFQHFSKMWIKLQTPDERQNTILLGKMWCRSSTFFGQHSPNQGRTYGLPSLWCHPQLQAGLGEDFKVKKNDWTVHLLVCASGLLPGLLDSVHVSAGLMWPVTTSKTWSFVKESTMAATKLQICHTQWHLEKHWVSKELVAPATPEVSPMLFI